MTIAMLAIAVALTSPEEYVATVPVCTNLIAGRVMGPDGDYNTMRAEDVAWLWEAANERFQTDALGLSDNKTRGIDSRTGRDLSLLNQKIEALTNCWSTFNLDAPLSPSNAVDALPPYPPTGSATNYDMLVLLQAGAAISRWPYYADADEVSFDGAPSLGTATNAFTLFTRERGAGNQRVAWGSSIFSTIEGTFRHEETNEWTTIASGVSDDGYSPWLEVSPHHGGDAYEEPATNYRASVLFDGAWTKGYGSYYAWAQKFINADGTHANDYAGMWSSAVTHQDYSLAEDYDDSNVSISSWGGFATNNMSCLRRDCKALLAVEVRAHRLDTRSYSEEGSSQGVPSWRPSAFIQEELLVSNVSKVVFLLRDARYSVRFGYDGTPYAEFDMDRPGSVAEDAVAAVTELSFFRECDLSYFTPIGKPSRDPPGYGKGASWSISEDVKAESSVTVDLLRIVLILEPDFPATIWKGNPESGD